MPAFAIFAQLTQLSQRMASQFPMTSPMAEQIQNQIRMAVSKVAESQQPQQQQVPPI